MENSKVLVIIPTLNAEFYIEKLIQSLLAQTINLDIYIIDSSSTDETINIVKKYNINYEIIAKKDFNHGLSRNKACQFIQYDYYLFMTQDALPYNKYLVENLLDSFKIDDVVISYARQIPYDDANDIEKYSRLQNYPPNSILKDKNSLSKLGIKTFFTSDSCCMYDVKYFREKQFIKTNTSEDMEFCARAIMDNKKVYYNANAKVYHSHNFSFILLCKRYQEIGKFFAQNLWIYDVIAKYKHINSDGIKFAINELKYLLNHNKILIPQSIIQSFIKYVCFKIGFFKGAK